MTTLVCAVSTSSGRRRVESSRGGARDGDGGYEGRLHQRAELRELRVGAREGGAQGEPVGIDARDEAAVERLRSIPV